MYEDGDEEHRVEIWDGRACALTETPGEAHDPIGNVILHEMVRKKIMRCNIEKIRTGLREYAHQPSTSRRLL